ncbi:MAG: CheR family methyltransferase [Myxococcota bacterium]
MDHLLSSLAREVGPRAVAIVLSGAGSDGSRGLRDIKAAGGLTIAQPPGAGSQPGMPQAAIDAGVDLVLDIADIPEALERFARLPLADREAPVPSPQPERPTHDDLRDLASILHARAGFDLRIYKTGTVERRLLRRMLLTDTDDVRTYLDRIRDHEEEQQALVRDMLIGVTAFFRDPDAFDALRTQVVAPMVEAAEPGTTLRGWVAGCATGEEAYSVAICLLEAVEAQGKRLQVRLFATDIDTEALQVARAGIYPPSIADTIPAASLQRWFRELEGRGWQARTELRDALSFAVHDLTRDPPFSRMDLISCRNVLIYLRPAAQEQVLRLIHFALNPRGALFLGTSESVGSRHERFAALSKRWRLYQKVGQSRVSALASPARSGPRSLLAEPTDSDSGAPRDRVPDRLRRAVLRARVPPTLVLDREGTVLFTHGELRPFLRFPEGDDPQLELGSIIAPELATRTRSALYRARRDGTTVTAEAQTDGGERVRVTASPAPDLGPEHVVLSFEALGEAVSEDAPAEPADEAIIDQLERELRATREDLRNTVEELETSNEELRSSNEESMSMNEELQSANEELEATTEELRSLNEELTTVNAQLRDKVEQLEQAHDDLDNFISSTKIATLFLDEALRIERYTPAARELLGVGHGDVGRFVGDIARDLLQQGLAEGAQRVLDELVTDAAELEVPEGWFVRRILPYRTETRRIEGVVVTFVDVTALKRATQRAEVRERQQAVIARLGQLALREPALPAFLDQVVREIRQTLDTDLCKLLELQPGGRQLLLRAGVGWGEGEVGQALVSAGLDSQAGYTLQSDQPVIVTELATERRFDGPPLLAEHGVVSGISCTVHANEEPYGVLGAHTRSARTFTREDIHFLQAVASVIGSAVAQHVGRMRLAVESGVSRALAEASGVDEASRALLRCLAEVLDAAVAEIWWPGDGGRLQCRLVVGDAVDVPRPAVAPGEGIVGRTYAEGQARWVTDCGEPAEALGPYLAAGMRACVAFPVRGGAEVVGVVAVYARKRLHADPAFLRSLEALGHSVGEFFRRTVVEEKARRLATIAESSQDAVLSYDFDGRITEWLGGAERMYGYASEEVVGGPLVRLVPADRRAELDAVNDRLRRGEHVDVLETERLRRDGHLVEVSVSTAAIRDPDGRVVGASSTDRDIGAHKSTERMLREADRQKDEFLAMLGHELRNPLAAVRSAAELLKTGDPAVLEETRLVLERQTTHMARLLDGLLDISRIIRGKIGIEREPVDLLTIVTDVVHDQAGRAEALGVLLRARLTDEPVWVSGDRVRLVQVVDNLVSNALKFTPRGGAVQVQLVQAGRTATIAVRDDGAGIDLDLLPHVFEVFRQGTQTLDRSRGGLGLGLALVHSLVQLHGGSVEAHSEGPETGAEFIVRLPTVGEPTTLPAPPLDSVGPMRIVLVEDNLDAGEMLRQVLELSGHEVVVATRGQEGVDRARELLPDVVLCDIGLPDGMTGYDVARMLRDDPATRHIRLVALTGYGRPEDRQRCLDAGFDAHVTKPVDVATMEQVLAG